MKFCPNCGYHNDLCRCDDVSSFKFKDDSSCCKNSNHYYSKPKENLIKPKERRVDSLSHSNSTKCPHCQSDPCGCANIQIENNPVNTNTNTVSPVFNINVTAPTPTPEPVQECECSGFLQDPITTANICTGCELEGSTVTFIPRTGLTFVGQVTDVACVGNTLTAFGTGTDPETGDEFQFVLTLVENPNPFPDFYQIFVLTPETGRAFNFARFVSDANLQITPCSPTGVNLANTNIVAMTSNQIPTIKPRKPIEIKLNKE